MEYSHADVEVMDLTDRFFGFCFELSLAADVKIASRSVYTLFQFASDLGGLSGALDWVFGLIVSFYAPAIYSRSILRHNFKFDSNTEEKKEKRNRQSSINSQVVVSDV